MNYIYYYLRDEQNAPRVTVCLAYEIENECQGQPHIFVRARGIALCSLKETPNKELGRQLAFKRAERAMLDMANLFPTNMESKKLNPVLVWMSVYNDEMTKKARKYLGDESLFKACHSPSPTGYEQFLLQKLLPKKDEGASNG